jgi:hypothetical protein
MDIKKGKFKGLLERDLTISLRISRDELAAIDGLCAERKKDKSKLCSRIDVIMLAIKFAAGQLTLLDRMEMNLLDNKSLFDTANFPKDKFGDLFKKVV